MMNLIDSEMLFFFITRRMNVTASSILRLSVSSFLMSGKMSAILSGAYLPSMHEPPKPIERMDITVFSIRFCSSALCPLSPFIWNIMAARMLFDAVWNILDAISSKADFSKIWKNKSLTGAFLSTSSQY